MRYETKGCPFNNFDPCVQEKCALYLKDVKATADRKGQEIEIKLDEAVWPCALTLAGTSACYHIAKEIAKPILS